MQDGKDSSVHGRNKAKEGKLAVIYVSTSNLESLEKAVNKKSGDYEVSGGVAVLAENGTNVYIQTMKIKPPMILCVSELKDSKDDSK